MRGGLAGATLGSALAAELHRRGVVVVHPTWTTRPRRPNETEACLDHVFVSDEKFDDLRARGFFAAVGSMPGLPYRYGLPPVPTVSAAPCGAVIVRAPYVEVLAAIVPRLLVYQIVERLDRTGARLRARGCSAVETRARLADHHAEIALGRQLRHRVFANDQSVTELAEKVTSALRADGAVDTEGARP